MINDMTKGGGDRKITMLMIDNINDKGGEESGGCGQRPRGDGGGGFFSLNFFKHIQLMVSCALHSELLAKQVYSSAFCSPSGIEPVINVPLKVPSQHIIKQSTTRDLEKSLSKSNRYDAKCSSKGGKGGLDRWGHGRQQVDGFTSNLDNFRNFSFDTFLN